MTGWMQFVIAIFALLVFDHAVVNICNTFGKRKPE